MDRSADFSRLFGVKAENNLLQEGLEARTPSFEHRRGCHARSFSAARAAGCQELLRLPSGSSTSTPLNWFFARSSPSNSSVRIYGAVADMCDELACRISGWTYTGLVAQEDRDTVVIPTALSSTNKSLRTDDNVQGNLLQNYEQQFTNFSRSSSTDQTGLQCSDHEDRGEVTVFHDRRLCGTGQIMWLMTRVLLPRDSAASKVKGEYRGKKKIGPALEVAVSHHQGRYGIEIMIESSFGDGTCSWVMIVNGRNQYVTEMIEETQHDHIDYIRECTGKFVAKARLKQTSTTTASSSTTTLLHHQRVRIDVEPGPYDKSCFEVSEKDDQVASTRFFSTRCDLHRAQNRSIQKYLETSSKHCVLVQYEARSGERIVILPNTITRDRLPQHTTCDLY